METKILEKIFSELDRKKKIWVGLFRHTWETLLLFCMI